MKFLLTTTTICYLLISSIQAGNQQYRVLLSDVQTLTLHRGKQTEARRVSAVPQLKCVGGSGKCAFQPDVVQCYNRGSDGVDIQWECKADMPEKYKFGTLSVSCEGYDYPEDPYILAGSCGLEYKIDLSGKYSRDATPSGSNSRIWPFLFKIALIVIVFFAVKSYLSNNSQAGGARAMGVGPDHRPPGGGGGGFFSNFFPGGSGGFGGSRPSAPPPPGFRPGFTDNDNYGPDCTTNRQQNTGTGGPGGFLTGAALGALGGYVFGTRTRRPDTQYMPGTANTGWFGGGTTTHRNNSSSSSSNSTYTSSGFGGTSRR